MKRLVLSLVFILSSPSLSANAGQPDIWIDGQNLNAKLMIEHGGTVQPIGHIGFCRRHPSKCKIKFKKSRLLTLTKKRWNQVVQINNYANRTITPITDIDHHGVLEHWDYPRTRGDCEDYVLLKQKLLARRGWPLNSLLVTVVRDELGDGHAVLTLRTAQGDYILDNKTNKISLWSKVPYQFIKRQSRQHTAKWVSLLPKSKFNTAAKRGAY